LKNAGFFIVVLFPPSSLRRVLFSIKKQTCAGYCALYKYHCVSDDLSKKSFFICCMHKDAMVFEHWLLDDDKNIIVMYLIV
jgi:hypothetical protein